MKQVLIGALLIGIAIGAVIAHAIIPDPLSESQLKALEAKAYSAGFLDGTDITIAIGNGELKDKVQALAEADKRWKLQFGNIPRP